MFCKRKLAWLGCLVALLSAGVAPVASAALEDVVSQRSPATCGEQDTPESPTTIQGDVPKGEQASGRAAEGYNCGLALVGFHNLANNEIPAGGNFDMAWSGNCAYVKHVDGLKIVHVNRRGVPQLVGRLTTDGARSGAEGIMARTTADRAILVVGLNGAEARDDVPVDIYDVSDCTEPVLLRTMLFPDNVHNLGLSMDATKVYASMPLQVVDITDLADPNSWTVDNFQCDVQKQALPGWIGARTFWEDTHECGPGAQLAHEFDFDPEDTRMYVGDQMPGEGNLYVLDTADWTVKGTARGPAHGIRRAEIGGARYLLHSNETLPVAPGYACAPEAANPIAGPAGAFLTRVTDDGSAATLTTVSELDLAINQPQNCPARLDSGAFPSIHYNEVDDAEAGRFALLGMGTAGLRIFDIRNPAEPVEVAYFNPGLVSGGLDSVFSHVRYDARTGLIWLSTMRGGVWVLELEPHVRTALGLSADDSDHPLGAPARPVSVVTAPVADQVDRALTGLFAYCSV